jgi:hypothetical protein
MENHCTRFFLFFRLMSKTVFKKRRLLMNKLIIAIGAALFSCSTLLAVQQPNNSQPQHQCSPVIDEDGVEVLSNFAGIVGNFIGITQDPHNSANVGSNLAGMIHGLANILTIATRAGKNLEEFVKTPEFQEQFAALVTTRMRCFEQKIDQQ